MLTKLRLFHLMVAEWMDAWRVIPRVIVAGYAYFMYIMILWYMDLQPYMLEGCDIDKLGEACIVTAPTSQHATLITAIVGVAAAVFGFYANSGKSWDNFTFTKWTEEK